VERLIARRYRLLDQLGRGGMGEVWRARDERLDREVAVKILHPWVADDPDLRDRLQREANALARLTHPSVVRLYDAKGDGKRSYIVMELVEGTSLSALIGSGRLTWDETRAYLRPVAEALAYAHRRDVVHRDLSPANVLVDGDSGRVVVTDFGLARLASGGRHSTLGLLVGTPEYWAPEQARGDATTAAADVYALGCILFNALSGRLPFEGEDRLASGLRRAHEDPPPLRDVAPDAPEEACVLVDAMLARDPVGRPSAADVARALGSAGPLSPLTEAETAVRSDEEPPTQVVVAGAEREPPTQVVAAPVTLARLRSAHTARRRRPLVIAGIVLAALLAAGAVGVYALAAAGDAHLEAPTLVGRSLVQARAVVRAAADDAGVTAPAVRVAGRRYSERLPAGAVLAQSPPAGDRLDPPSALSVRLSLGSALAAVPSVSAMRTRDAARALREQGFTPVMRWAPSRSVPVGFAIETRPAEGERVRRPAEVEVFESTGPPLVRVPDVVGEGADSAVSALEDAGFSTTVEQRFEADADPGTVLEASPSAGERARYGSQIALVVASDVSWETLGSVQADGARRIDPVLVPSGARVVITVDSGTVSTRWSGDEDGEQQTSEGNTDVLVDPADGSRQVSFEIEPVEGDASWEMRLEAPSGGRSDEGD
jgi:serine/threonine-protein kinase